MQSVGKSRKLHPVCPSLPGSPPSPFVLCLPVRAAEISRGTLPAWHSLPHTSPVFAAHPPATDMRRQRQQCRHRDRKSTRLNSSHPSISYAVFCLKKKNQKNSSINYITKKKYHYLTIK